MAGSRDSARVVAVAAVAALAIGVGALAALALQSVRGGENPGTAGPAPTFTFGDRGTPSAEPTPTAEPAPVLAPADERFLAVFDDQVWRGVAGSCGGAAPVVELSEDGGETWITVTPPQARQVLSLAALGIGQGEVIAATGDDCAPAALRTYTTGAAWESYPNVLAASTFVSPSDPATIVSASATFAAPCAVAQSVRVSRGTVGVLCEGTAYVRAGEQWLPLAASAVATDAVGGEIVVAHVTEACAGGLEVSRFDGGAGALGSLGCLSGVDGAARAALSVLDPDVVLWSGDALHRPE